MLTIPEIKEYRDIGKKYDEDKLKEIIVLAKLDMESLIGHSFYYEIDNNKQKYKDLLNGCSFEYNGLNFNHLGLKSIFADYVYSRLMMVINVNISPFGSVVKDSQNSTPTDKHTLTDLQRQAKLDASRKFEIVKKYIYSNSELNNIYKGYKTDQSDQSYSPKFYKI